MAVIGWPRCEEGYQSAEEFTSKMVLIYIGLCAAAHMRASACILLYDMLQSERMAVDFSMVQRVGEISSTVS